MIFVRRLTRVLLILLVVGILANDGIKVATALSKASDGMNAALSASRALAAVTPADVDSAQAAAVTAAEANGATLDSYTQEIITGSTKQVVRITLSVSVRVNGTVIAPAVLGLINKVPSAEWYTPGSARVITAQKIDIDLYGAAAP